MKPMPPLTLILRFRDLVRPEPGYTVAQHNEIVRKHGHTWWGWWKKQTEEIPVEVWSTVARQAATGSSGIRALLLDSGQRKLYSTQILDVSFRPSHEHAPSPEADKTPEYYNPPDNPTSMASWFKITEIKEVNADAELNKLMYAVPPHDDLILGDFKDRKVGGIPDLLSFGNVTYWVGTAISDSARTPLRKVDVRIIPAIAPRDVIRAESARILHISDLHLAEGFHAFPLKDGDMDKPSLAAAIYQAVKAEHLIPGIVIVSGDLTWSGTEEEFDLAFNCLDAIRSTLGLQRQHFVIVPGNHDIQWTKKANLGAGYHFDEKVEVASDVARANYLKFFQRWYGTEANEFLSVGRRCFLVGGPTVDILGLNSCALQQTEGHFAGVGRVTEKAIDDSADQLGWREGVRATSVRIVVGHHHVIPVVAREKTGDAEKGFGIALDAGMLVSKMLTMGVDLLLHGHQHQPFVGYVNKEEVSGKPISSKGLLVLGGGSAGVADKHLGPIKQRSFSLIHLGSDDVRVQFFMTHALGDQFEPGAAELVARRGESWKRVDSKSG